MKVFNIKWITGLFFASVLLMAGCQKEMVNDDQASISAKGGPGGGGKEETVGNNLSFPVIWSEGQELTLRTAPTGLTDEDVLLEGSWWYVWGEDPIDPEYPIFSCQPSPANPETCLDGSTPGDGTSTVYKAWLQKDARNFWKAYNEAATELTNVDQIDWGDNLESVSWTLTSKVRTEVVLYENMLVPVTQYAMRHVSGWGIDEVHGMQTTTGNEVVYGPGTQATVYSRHARLTIQKLSESPANLTWDAITHSWIGDANSPIFNTAVHEALDGSGYYNAEVNVKGKVIFGYTWDLKRLNDGAGVYRITFSFDTEGPGTTLNTFFDSNTTILVPVEEEIEAAAALIADAEPGAGGVAVVDPINNITYIDVIITPRGGGRK